MWFNMADNQFAFQNSPDITPFKIGTSYLVHRVCCHLENCKTSDWGGVFSLLTSLYLIGKSKSVNR